jgi:ubiquinone/menaquinone biosynthesis C-methylase UbiE
MQEFETEEKRIKAAYAKRDTRGKSVLYEWHQPAETYISYRKKIAWAESFKRASIESFKHVEILDVGCGRGGWIRMLIEWGARPHTLHGIDLLADRIAEAKSLSPPETDFRVGNGWHITYPDASMNLCAASTVLSSILDKKARKSLAREMSRVTVSQGWVMIYDFAFSDPRNPDTIGITRREIRKILSELKLVSTHRLLLAPPLLRRIPRNLMWLAHALEISFPFLCTHRLYVLRKV